MNSKQWGLRFLMIIGGCFSVIIGLTVWIDPLFHYHSPLEYLSYDLKDERYQNNGIAKHLKYDAVITGTSMTENFRTSQLDELFGVQSVKMSFQGSTFYELNNNLKVALENNPNIKLVVRDLYGTSINQSAKALNANYTYPNYLYDNNIWNDVSYVLNKDILINRTIETLLRTKKGQPNTNFDQYARWNDLAYFGKPEVLVTYKRPILSTKPVPFTENDRQTIHENIEQNVLDLVRKYPNTQFYLFYSPFSMYNWDHYMRINGVEKRIETFKEATRLLVEYPNVHLFSFLGAKEIVSHAERYKDMDHHDAKGNDQILEWMKEGKYQLTSENYDTYFLELKEFVLNYNYDQLFE